jgi:hypothetical protein
MGDPVPWLMGDPVWMFCRVGTLCPRVTVDQRTANLKQSIIYVLEIIFRVGTRTVPTLHGWDIFIAAICEYLVRFLVYWGLMDDPARTWVPSGCHKLKNIKI